MRAYKPQSTRKIPATNLPVIALRQMSSTSFQFNGQTYPVATCSTSIFKSAVNQAHPKEFGEAMGRLLVQEELDIFDRWYVVCELARLRTPLNIVAS